jgi:hypothetical protein
MAEEAPGIRNKGMLLIALALGAIVVVVYNVHVNRIREEGRGRTVKLLRFTHDRNADEVIRQTDLEAVPVDKGTQDSLGSVIPADDISFAVGQKLNQGVLVGQWLRYGHIGQTDPTQPSALIHKGMVGRPVPLDPQLVPGDILRVGDRVNLLGSLSMGGKPQSIYRIVAGVRVRAIGGRGPRDTEGPARPGAPDAGMRAYRSITVEVAPDVSLQLATILSYVQGGLTVELLNPAETISERREGKINPDEPELLKLAAGPARGGTPPPPGPE